MLCPDCRVSTPGGSLCSQCHNQVPERETFSGQGGYYLRLLVGIGLVLFSAFVIATSARSGFVETVRRLYQSGWLWIYVGLFLLPISMGVYYWYVLHDEEVTVTDEYIARRSYWGDEKMYWTQVQEFRCLPLLFRQTRLRRVAWVSRLLARERLIWHLPTLGYELVGRSADSNEQVVMRLEPGTIDDLPWLLELISERVGPDREVA